MHFNSWILNYYELNETKTDLSESKVNNKAWKNEASITSILDMELPFIPRGISLSSGEYNGQTLHVKHYVYAPAAGAVYCKRQWGT